MIFKKYGKTAQLEIKNAEDLKHLAHLNPSLWAASSAPTHCFHSNPQFLSLMDREQKGRIRIRDVQESAKWLLNVLKDVSPIDENSDRFIAECVNQSTPEGLATTRAAHFINEHEKVRKPIDLLRIYQFRKSYALRPPNGDGIITPHEMPSKELENWILKIMSISGSTIDASKNGGIDQSILENFKQKLKETQNWRKQLESLPQDQKSPFGENSAKILEILDNAIPAIDLYFAQSSLLSRKLPDIEKNLHYPSGEIDFQDAKSITEWTKKSLPVSHNQSGMLSLTEASKSDNHWSETFQYISHEISMYVFGERKEEIAYSDWKEIKNSLSSCIKFSKLSAPFSLETLSETEINNFYDDEIEKKLLEKIKEDESVKNSLKDLEVLEKLLLLQKHLIPFCCNFVNFSELFNPSINAQFEEGDLFIDGYQLAFSMKVTNRNSHKAYAQNSKIFIIYCEITDRDSGGHKFEVAAPVTAGNRYNFRIGKRGIFRDYKQLEWDAKIIDILEQPISVNEAVKAPFIRVYQSLEKRFEKFAQEPIKDLEQSAEKGFSKQLSTLNPSETNSLSQNSDPQGTRNLLIAGSVAIAALGSSLAYVVKTLISISFLKIIVCVLGLVFLAWGAAFLIAWLSLRKRDLTAFLEAADWAVNLRMPLVRKLRKLFTRKPKLPAQAKIERWDQLNSLIKKLDRS